MGIVLVQRKKKKEKRKKKKEKRKKKNINQKSMKKIATLLVFVLVGTMAFSQETEKKISPFDSWPELKEFHGVMSGTFHPSEEGNLEPIKTRATEMKDKAAVLASSKIPADLDNEKVKAAVSKLKDNTVAMEKMVNDKKSDKEITEYLSVIHDTFHEIVGLCRHE